MRNCESSNGRTSALLKRLEGLTVALRTPLNRNLELDVGALERLVARVVEGGVSCLFALGWAGEGPLLPQSTRELMMRETCRLAGGKLPVMVGISEQSLPRALELAQMATAAGADLLLSTPPYSYPIPQELVYSYFKQLAAQGGAPVVVYQNDEVGVRVEYDTLMRLSETPGVVAVKAYTNFVELQRWFHRAHKPGRFAVMSGDEYVYAAALLMGIRHFTMGGPGNLCPGWCTSIYRSALKGDWKDVACKHRRMTDFCDALYIGTETSSAAIKYALSCLGICSDRITSPYRTLPSKHKKQVRDALDQYADVVKQ